MTSCQHHGQLHKHTPSVQMHRASYIPHTQSSVKGAVSVCSGRWVTAMTILVNGSEQFISTWLLTLLLRKSFCYFNTLLFIFLFFALLTNKCIALRYYYSATFTLLYKERYTPASGQAKLARITFIISIP